MISLSDAMKAARRGTYKYGSDWRVLVGCSNHQAAVHVFDEIKSITEASSMGIEKALRATLTIQLDKGGLIRVAGISDAMDAYCHGGRTYTQIVWLYTPDINVEEYCKAFLRSNTVPETELRFDYADW